MAIFQSGDPVSSEFLVLLQTLGYGDTATPGDGEIRVFIESGIPYIKRYNSATATWLNCQIPQGAGSGMNADLVRSLMFLKGRQTITSSGTTIYFPEQFATTPNVYPSGETACTITVSSRTKTTVVLTSSIASVMAEWLAVG